MTLLAALLGSRSDCSSSAFARTEFQAVQFMPAFVLPQLLLAGLFVPRDEMATALRWAADAMPLAYLVEAMRELTGHPALTGTLVRDMTVIAGCTALALLLGAATLPRRTH